MAISSEKEPPQLVLSILNTSLAEIFSHLGVPLGTPDRWGSGLFSESLTIKCE